jgi:hypothetical protein
MYKVAQMEFRQILTESFNCQMLRKAKIVFFSLVTKNTVINYDAQKISNGFSRRRCKSLMK